MPEHAGAWLNRGRALAALNRFDDALASYGKALAVQGSCRRAFQWALALLTQRRISRAALRNMKSRWRRTGMAPQKSRGKPLWLGEYPLARKTMLLHAEQGLGDTIQFARYVPLLAAAGAKVVLEVQPELKTLMARLDGAAAVIARGEALPPFDVHCPLGSLPLALQDRAGHGAGANSLSVGTTRRILQNGRRGSARCRGRASPSPGRAMPATTTIATARSPSAAWRRCSIERIASFISIQRDVRSEDAAALAASGRVTHVGDELEDFADTAAVLRCAIWSSRSIPRRRISPAPWAGRSGCWCRSRRTGAGRSSGDTTPWYPTARLFRQTALGDWDGVIARVGDALVHFIGENAAGK